jgi:hypothetical protein
MTGTCLRSGWRAALGRPRLVATLWFWNLLMGLIVGLGMSRWLGAAFNGSPVADQALERFRFGLLAELTQYDRFSPFTFLGGTLSALALIAMLSNALLAAGVLEVLVSDDPRPLLHRFFRGAGHFFGRFLRLLIVTGIALIILWIIMGAITSPIVRAIGESSWERTWIAVALGRFALLGILVALLMAVLDVARAQVASSPVEQRGMLRAWVRSVPIVFHNLGTIGGIYLVLGVCWVALALVGLAVVFAVTPNNWAAIWLLILVQQVFMFARAGIRVARAGAILGVARAAVPVTPGLEAAWSIDASRATATEEDGAAGLKAGGYTSPVSDRARLERGDPA